MPASLATSATVSPRRAPLPRRGTPVRPGSGRSGAKFVAVLALAGLTFHLSPSPPGNRRCAARAAHARHRHAAAVPRNEGRWQGHPGIRRRQPRTKRRPQRRSAVAQRQGQGPRRPACARPWPRSRPRARPRARPWAVKSGACGRHGLLSVRSTSAFWGSSLEPRRCSGHHRA